MAKNTVMIIGIFLVALGIFALVYDRQTFRTRENVIDVGPLHASVERDSRCDRLPVIFGALVIIAGGALVLMHFNRRP